MKQKTYTVRWTETKNGIQTKRKLTVACESLAKVMFDRLILTCKHYDTTLTESKG